MSDLNISSKISEDDNASNNTLTPLYFADSRAIMVYEVLQNPKAAYENPIKLLCEDNINLCISITNQMKIQYGDGTNITDGTALGLANKINQNWMAPLLEPNYVMIFQNYKFNRDITDCFNSIKFLLSHTNGIIYGNHPISIYYQGISGVSNIIKSFNIYNQQLNPINFPEDRGLEFIGSLLGKGLDLEEKMKKYLTSMNADISINNLQTNTIETDKLINETLLLINNEISKIENFVTNSQKFTDVEFITSNDTFDGLLVRSIGTNTLKNTLYY